MMIFGYHRLSTGGDEGYDSPAEPNVSYERSTRRSLVLSLKCQASDGDLFVLEQVYVDPAHDVQGFMHCNRVMNSNRVILTFSVSVFSRAVSVLTSTMCSSCNGSNGKLMFPVKLT